MHGDDGRRMWREGGDTYYIYRHLEGGTNVFWFLVFIGQRRIRMTSTAQRIGDGSASIPSM